MGGLKSIFGSGLAKAAWAFIKPLLEGAAEGPFEHELAAHCSDADLDELERIVQRARELKAGAKPAP